MRVRWNENTYLVIWIHVFDNVNMYICLCQDTGAMNRSPTPNGMFATNFVGVRHVIGKPSAMFWQTVSSRRGGFIVPAYMKTPTK